MIFRLATNLLKPVNVISQTFEQFKSFMTFGFDAIKVYIFARPLIVF